MKRIEVSAMDSCGVGVYVLDEEEFWIVAQNNGIPILDEGWRRRFNALKVGEEMNGPAQAVCYLTEDGAVVMTTHVVIQRIE